jgi:hypothetical protein
VTKQKSDKGTERQKQQKKSATEKQRKEKIEIEKQTNTLVWYKNIFVR